jgi:hypothetical protein
MAKRDVLTFEVCPETGSLQLTMSHGLHTGARAVGAIIIEVEMEGKFSAEIEFNGIEILEELNIKLFKYYSDLREKK